MKTLARWADGLFSLFYPKLCLACGQNLALERDLVCLDCQASMPRPDFHLTERNEMSDRFWGRLDARACAAQFYFSKERRTQRLVHQLKYRDKPDLAVRLGRSFGRELARSPLFEGIDCAVPVPLHPKKERLRGYNQAEKFAEGLCESLGCSLQRPLCRREHHARSQASRDRKERFAAVEGLYGLERSAEKLAGKSILLVDDVLTTGATLEACGSLLLQIPRTQLRLAVIAFASKKFY